MVGLDVLLGICCALVLLLFMVHIFAFAHIYLSKESQYPFELSDLRSEPDGIEEWIKTPDGALLRSLHKGSGSPIILMHDKGVSLVTMNLMWRFLSSAGYRVITYDHRGHGQSSIGNEGLSASQMTEDLKTILEFYDIKQGILVGHSYGAYLSMRYILDHMDTAANRVKGVVSLGGFKGDLIAGFSNNSLIKKLVRWGILSKLLSIKMYSWIFAAAYFGGIPHKDYVQAFLEIFSARPLKRLLPIMNDQEVSSYYHRLREIQTPYSLMYGTEDRIHSLKKTLMIADNIDKMHFKWAEEGRGYMLVWECPAKIVEIVRRLEYQIAV